MELSLKSTFFDSPHGLINWCNRSTALDLARLCTFCMKDQKFRQIVGTKFYKVPKVTEHGRNQRTYNWENTQKLLWNKGVNGIKTGVTTSAGPCLVTSLSKDGYDLIIVLLCCKSLEARWIETNKLANWSIARMSKMKSFQQQVMQNSILMCGGSSMNGGNNYNNLIR